MSAPKRNSRINPSPDLCLLPRKVPWLTRHTLPAQNARLNSSSMGYHPSSGANSIHKSSTDAILCKLQRESHCCPRKSNAIRTKLRFNPSPSVLKLVLAPLLLYLNLVGSVSANNLPQFLLSDGQSEIVLRLKEGPATPVGSLIYTLKGIDR